MTIASRNMAAWAYASRIWIAMMVALGASFWLQLDSASSSATCVAILAQPKRGQALQKAVFRITATLIGFLASIAITALFSQSRDVFIVAVAIWIAGAVYFASCYDGTRAYGFVLSGYTVAIISVIQIDAPQTVFNVAIARVAVEVIGIVSITVINDALAAPELWPDVQNRMEACIDDVEMCVEGLIHGTPPHSDHLRSLIARLTALRLDVLALASERPEGGRQSACGQSALAAMVAALFASRVVNLMHHVLPEADVDAAAERIDKSVGALGTELNRAVAGGWAREIAIARFSLDVTEQRALARRELAAMIAGRRAERYISLPIHREKKESFRKALRVFISIVVAGSIFSLSNWPATATAYAQFAVLAALSATQASATFFAASALIALPVIVTLVGIVEFLILDGTDSFQLLALSMAPVVVLSCFLFLRPRTAGIGFIMLVYLPVLLMPSNPQNYSADNYIYISAFSISAALMLFVALNAFVPTTDKDRRRWMIERLRGDLLAAVADRAKLPPAEALWLATERVVQISNFKIGCETARAGRLRYMLLLTDLVLATGHAQVALDDLQGAAAQAARRALANLHPGSIAEAAQRLAAGIAAAPETRRGPMIQAVASMSFLADALSARATDLRHLRQTLRP